MLKATWDWYYGSSDEELLSDCEFGDPYQKHNKKEVVEVIVRPGKFGNGDSVNIYSMHRKRTDESSHLEICSQHLKVLRHPGILHFLGCVTVDTEVHLVTEHAYPLNTLLELIDAHEICSGLHDIALALEFIHDKASITHNYVVCKSIYVKDSGPWKLGQFDYACRFDEATEEYLQQNSNYISPPEEKGLDKVKLPLKSAHGHCRDVYYLGLLLKEFFDKVQFSATILKKNLEEVIEDLTREDYENRPTVKEILTMPIFKSDYICIVHFLQSVTLRSMSEKEDFFKSLLSKLNSNFIFAEVVGRRIIPLLLTPIVFAEKSAVDYVIKDILTPASERVASATKEVDGILPESVFARYVIPKIVELFKSRLIHVRLVLMQTFSKYVHLFESSILNDVVLPEVLLGLHDTNNQLVQWSLHALADAIPVVGGDVIVGTEREKIFSPSIPKFDGRALNETQAIAYKAKIPLRKKVQKKLPLPSPKKPTLLELAMMKRAQKGVQEVPTNHVLLKQKQFAHSLVEKSQVKLNGHVVSEETNRKNAPKTERPSVTSQTINQPEVETWVSSSGSDTDMDWPDINGDPSDAEDIPKSVGSVSPPEKTLASPEVNDSKVKVAPEKQKKSLIVKGKKHAKSGWSSPESSVHSHNSKDSSDPNKLGSEFEINVKPKTSAAPKDDFFADMEPNIKPAINNLPLSNGKATKQSSTSPVNNGSSFSPSNEDWEFKSASTSISSAFNAPDEDENDGWDDDLINWN